MIAFWFFANTTMRGEMPNFSEKPKSYGFIKVGDIQGERNRMEQQQTNDKSRKDDISASQDLKRSDSNNIYWKPSRHTPAWRPPTDVFETKEDVLVRIEIAGMRESNFSIELNGHHLVVKGTRQDIMEKRSYHQMEIHFGEFMIELDIAIPINPEQVEAIYQNGFLLIRLPKASPRQINIEK
jgi:HSP20 family protein